MWFGSEDCPGPARKRRLPVSFRVRINILFYSLMHRPKLNPKLKYSDWCRVCDAGSRSFIPISECDFLNWQKNVFTMCLPHAEWLQLLFIFFDARKCIRDSILWGNKSFLLFFFTDCDIVGKVNGVCFTYSKEGRPSGEAFIELKTADDFKNALSKDRKYMGHRYIEGKQYNHTRLTLREQLILCFLFE